MKFVSKLRWNDERVVGKILRKFHEKALLLNIFSYHTNVFLRNVFTLLASSLLRFNFLRPNVYLMSWQQQNGPQIPEKLLHPSSTAMMEINIWCDDVTRARSSDNKRRKMCRESKRQQGQIEILQLNVERSFSFLFSFAESEGEREFCYNAFSITLIAAQQTFEGWSGRASSGASK